MGPSAEIVLLTVKLECSDKMSNNGINLRIDQAPEVPYKFNSHAKHNSSAGRNVQNIAGIHTFYKGFVG